MNSKLLCIIILFSLYFSIFDLRGQEYEADELPMTGLIFDDDAVEKVPVKPMMLTRDYKSLPRAVSLVKWAPVPKSQGQYGTCTSWATTYAARTITEAINNGWTDRQKITSEAFAPNFIYTQIKFPDDSECKRGSCIDDALYVLLTKGAPKLHDFNIDCATYIPNEVFQKAQSYTIDDYFRIFNLSATPKFKIDATKKSISENRPVIIGMKVPESFQRSHGKDLWLKTETHNDGGGHAMCVVGYDDDKYGGAFLIMNSWGTTWGNNGMIWVKYADYAANVKYGFEIFLRKETPKPQPTPTPQPTPKPEPKPVPVPKDINKFAGSMRFQLSSGENMQPTLTNGIYRMNGDYVSGTRYRIYLSNNEPGYVYVIGSDATNEVTQVFPPDEKTSAALVYKSNNIALPNEDWFIEMDDTRGTDNVCVLFSKKSLDMPAIMRLIEAGSGTFKERVSKVLGDKQVKGVNYSQNSISFTAAGEASIVPLFVEIKHI